MAVVVIVEFAIVRNCGYYTATLGDIAPFTSDNAYPRLFFINDLYNMDTAFDSGSASRIVVNGILIAFMSILETAMSQEVVNEYTNSEGDLNKQFIALGN